MDDQRDYEEESYWRQFCAECDTAPCQSSDKHAELETVLAGDVTAGMILSHEGIAFRTLTGARDVLNGRNVIIAVERVDTGREGTIRVSGGHAFDLVSRATT